MAYYYNCPPYVQCPPTAPPPGWGYPGMFYGHPLTPPPQQRGKGPRRPRGQPRRRMEFQGVLRPAPVRYPAPAYLQSYQGGSHCGPDPVNYPGLEQTNESTTGQQGLVESAPTLWMTDLVEAREARAPQKKRRPYKKGPRRNEGNQECPTPECTQHPDLCQSDDSEAFSTASDASSYPATNLPDYPPQFPSSGQHGLPAFAELVAPSSTAVGVTYEGHPLVGNSEILFPDIAGDYGYFPCGPYPVEPCFQNEESNGTLETIYPVLNGEMADGMPMNGQDANRSVRHVDLDVPKTHQDEENMYIGRMREDAVGSGERIRDESAVSHDAPQRLANSAWSVHRRSVEFNDANTSEDVFDRSMTEWRGPHATEMNLARGIFAVDESKTDVSCYQEDHHGASAATSTIQNSTITSFSGESDSSQLDCFLAQCLGSELSKELLNSCPNYLSLDVGEVTVEASGCLLPPGDPLLSGESQVFSDGLGDDFLGWTTASSIGPDGQDLKKTHDTSVQTDWGVADALTQTNLKTPRISRKSRAAAAEASKKEEQETDVCRSIVEKISALQKENNHAIAEMIQQSVEESISNIAVPLVEAFSRALAQHTQAIGNRQETGHEEEQRAERPITVHLPIQDLHCQVPNQPESGEQVEGQRSSRVEHRSVPDIGAKSNNVVESEEETNAMSRSSRESPDSASDVDHCSSQKRSHAADIRDFFPKSESSGRLESKPNQDSDDKTGLDEGDFNGSGTLLQPSFSSRISEESSSETPTAPHSASKGSGGNDSPCQLIDNILDPDGKHRSKRRSRTNKKTAAAIDRQRDSLQNDAHNLNIQDKKLQSYDGKEDGTSMQQQKRLCYDPPKMEDLHEGDMAMKKNCSEATIPTPCCDARLSQKTQISALDKSDTPQEDLEMIPASTIKKDITDEEDLRSSSLAKKLKTDNEEEATLFQDSVPPYVTYAERKRYNLRS